MSGRRKAGRVQSAGYCPGCGRLVAALRDTATGNLLLRSHHRSGRETHLECRPPRGNAGRGGRWWAKS